MHQLYNCLNSLYHKLYEFKDLSQIEFIEKSHEIMGQIQYPEVITDRDVIDLTLNLKEFPHQYYTEKRFGEFNITVFYNEYFSIQLYIMNEIDTEIHDHSFVGCYQILQGSNITTEYEFVKKSQLDEDVFVGDVRIKQIMQFQKNDRRQIYPGTIHQITRLEPKNITLMVMKQSKKLNHLYLPPSLCIEYPDLLRPTVRNIFGLDYLHKHGSLSEREITNFLDKQSTKSLLSLAIRHWYMGLTEDFSKDFEASLMNYLTKKNLKQYIDEYIKYMNNLKAKANALKKISN